MTIYVDDRQTLFQGLHLSLMIADSEAELHAFAAKIGLQRRWFLEDYYQVSKEMRLTAIVNGAVPVTSKELQRIRRKR